MSNILSFDKARERKMADGFCPVPTEIIEAMASGRLTSREFQIVCAVIRKTFGWNKQEDTISGSQFSALTGMKRQDCSSIVSRLIQRGVLVRSGGSRSPIKVNTEISNWVEPEKATKSNLNARVNSIPESSSVNSISVHSANSNVGHTIDNTDTMNTPTEYLSSAPAEVTQSKPKSGIPNCPYQAIVDIYHEILPELREVKILNDTRKRLIKARWRSKAKKTECWSLDFWRRYFQYVRDSDFLMGRVNPRPGKNIFTADLEWLVRPENFTKVVEGKYHDQGE